MKNFLKKNYRYILFTLIFFIINCVFFYSFHASIGKSKVLIILTLLIIYIILAILVFYLKEKKHFKLHKIFLVVAPVLGVLYIFIMPLCAPPDEPNHFRRAYEISEGFILSDRNDQNIGGRTLPDSITVALTEPKNYAEIPEIFSNSIDSRDEKFQTFANTSLYSPISYLPEVIGIWIGKILHLPIFMLVYLARFFNLACWVILVYYAIKITPRGKATFFLLALLPISMQSATSCQADALVNASTLVFFAFILSKIKNPIKLSQKESIATVALTIIISMCKIVYIPICFLLYLLPRECFNSKKDKILKVSILLLVVVALNLIWLSFSSGYLIEFMPEVNSGEQLHYILSNPFNYLSIIANTFATHSVFYLISGLGGSLGNLCINLSEIYILFLGFFIMYTYLNEDRRQFDLSVLQKIVISIISILCIGLICTSLYIQWTAFSADTIDGIQGRYFLPIVPMLLFLLTPLNNRKNSFNYIYPVIIGISINIYALGVIMSHYLI